QLGVGDRGPRHHVHSPNRLARAVQSRGGRRRVGLSRKERHQFAPVAPLWLHTRRKSELRLASGAAATRVLYRASDSWRRFAAIFDRGEALTTGWPWLMAAIAAP